MAHSLEARVPFLDKFLISNVIGIPSEYKIVGNETKYAFRQVCKETLEDLYNKIKEILLKGVVI